MGHQLDLKTALRLATMLAVGLFAGATVAWAQDRGICVRADVPEAFTLPDGSVHAAGRIALCNHRAFTPMIALHRVWVDGDGATLVMSRRTAADEYRDNRPALLFRRTPDGALDLVGYVVPLDRKSWKYTMNRPAGNGLAGRKVLGSTLATGDLVTLIASAER